MWAHPATQANVAELRAPGARRPRRTGLRRRRLRRGRRGADVRAGRHRESRRGVLHSARPRRDEGRRDGRADPGGSGPGAIPEQPLLRDDGLPGRRARRRAGSAGHSHRGARVEGHPAGGRAGRRDARPRDAGGPGQRPRLRALGRRRARDDGRGGRLPSRGADRIEDEAHGDTDDDRSRAERRPARRDRRRAHGAAPGARGLRPRDGRRGGARRPRAPESSQRRRSTSSSPTPPASRLVARRATQSWSRPKPFATWAPHQDRIADEILDFVRAAGSADATPREHDRRVHPWRTRMSSS